MLKRSAIFLLFLAITICISSGYSQFSSVTFEKITTNVLQGEPLADGQSKFLGCAHSSIQARDFTQYWNQVTPENGGKWGSVEGARDKMNWSELDAAYNLAKNNDFPFRLHVLVWGNQQPSWIESLPASEQLEEIEEWFSAVADRYPDIDYLEVVNEPLHDPPNKPGSGGGNYINALGGSNDLYGTGWDWVIKAFELAREYFPSSTKLMINDYGIVNDSGATTRYLSIINLLIERDLIDGIGVQGHAFCTGTTATTMISNLDKLAETGLPIQICEMDIDGPTDEQQLNDYKRIFPAFWEHPGVEGITFWGWRPGMWRTNEKAYLVNTDGSERPALQWLRTYIINPKAPKLISPPYYERNVPRNPVLTWKPTDPATSYNVQIAKRSSFTDIVLDTTVTDTFLQVPPLQASVSYYWHVKTTNEKGSSEYSNYFIFRTGDQIISNVNNLVTKQENYQLFQNYPNPFNPVTNIEFTLPTEQEVTLVVYDLMGKVVKQLASGHYSSGHHKISFDGTSLPSGVYLYSLTAGEHVTVKKLILAK